MKNKIYEGLSEQFTTEDFEKLMREIDADRIVETDETNETDFNEWCKKLSVYFSHKDNVTLVHSQEGIYSKITLYGSPRKMSAVKTKVLEAIAAVKSNPEGFRID